MISQKNFASVLFALRKERKLSLEALGKAIGVTNQAISLLEKGKRLPGHDTLIALADYFDVSIDYLVGRTDNPQINR